MNDMVKLEASEDFILFDLTLFKSMTFQRANYDKFTSPVPLSFFLSVNLMIWEMKKY